MVAMAEGYLELGEFQEAADTFPEGRLARLEDDEFGPEFKSHRLL
jgi:hypothetical protein